MIYCPLTGATCHKPIRVQEKTFFLAEPQENSKKRQEAIRLALGDEYEVWTAPEEGQRYAFSCQVCEMIQSAAYGIADVTDWNPKVMIELGMLFGFGKPIIVLHKSSGERKLVLPWNVKAIYVIPFEEYIDIVELLKKIASRMPLPVREPSILVQVEQIVKEANPQLAEQVRAALEVYRRERLKTFKDIAITVEREAVSAEEKAAFEAPTEPMERLTALGKSLDRQEKLDLAADIKKQEKLGVFADVKTARLRGNAYYWSGKYEEAIMQYDWALDIEPDDANTWYFRGRALTKLKRFEEAIESYSEALRIDPTDIWTMQNLAETQLVAENYPAGLSLAEKSLESSRTPKEKWVALFLIISALLLQNKSEEADLKVGELEEHLSRVKGRYGLTWDFSQIRATLEEKLPSPRKELALSLISLLREEIDLEEFRKRRKALAKEG